MALPSTTIRQRTLMGAIIVAAVSAGVITPVISGHAHAAPATAVTAQASCDGVTGELMQQNTAEWYSSTVIKLTNHTDTEKPITLKVQLPGDAKFENNRADRFQDVVSGNEVTVTGSLAAHEDLKEYGFGLHNTLSEAHQHLHPMGEITLNGAPLGSCTDTGAQEEASTELTAKACSKKDKVDLYFADLSIPTGGDPSDRYEIFVDGKLATTAVFGSSKLSKNGDEPVKQLKQVLPLGDKAGVEYKVKVRPVGHHPGAFTNEITVTSGK